MRNYFATDRFQLLDMICRVVSSEVERIRCGCGRQALRSATNIGDTSGAVSLGAERHG